MRYRTFSFGQPSPYPKQLSVLSVPFSLPLRLVFGAAFWLLASLQPLQANLPVGWSDRDIGAPPLAGTADYVGGLWTVSAGGADICSSDQLHFVWKPLTGDGTISARVENIQNAASGQAGVMFRNDLTTSGIEVAVLATSNNGVTFQWRSTPSAGCSYQVIIGVQNLGTPVWVRLSRSGNSFSGYWSTNNLEWYQVGSTQTVPLGETALAGLAASANDAAALCRATFSDVVAPTPVFGIYRELWTGLDPSLGNSLAALTNSANNPNWPDKPDSGFTDVYTQWETQTNSGLSYYGQRLRAFVVPPLSGDYTFSLASDDTSQLFLSSDESPDHKVPVAWVSTATSPRQWTKEPNQQSAPLRLLAGRRYYLEALMQQSTGTDNLAVRWQLPSGAYEEPLAAVSPAGTHLIPFTGKNTAPSIYVQPKNLIVSDGLDAVFSVLSVNQAPVAYQWQANGTNLPGPDATGPVCTVSRVNPYLDHNRVFTCVLSNAVGAVTSAPAVLTVIADIVAPTVARAIYLGETNLQVVFSEPIQPATATNLANYQFTNGLPILAATLQPDNLTVALTTGPLVFGSNYVLVVNGILDRATTPNPIQPDTLVFFAATPYTFESIGSAIPPGRLQATADGYDISAGGRDIGGTSDQFQFAYQACSGNFDVKVRVGALDQTDPYAKAGLMVREEMSPGSRFAAVLATPTINGALFQARSTPFGMAPASGTLPVNYPDTWLRLQRTGDQFVGYASYDGLTWQQLGAVTLSLTNTLYLGMAVCSHNTSQAATAQFREFSAVTNATTGVLALPNEPLGPSSRRTGLAITELMYHPQARTDGRNLEFIEIFNPQPFFEDISGYALSGDVAFTFPPGTVLAAGAYLVVAAAPADLRAVYGIPNVVGPYTNNLSNSSGTVRLRNKIGAVLLEVKYDSVPPWPAAADGAGHSLVLARPSYGEADVRAWGASDRRGGSPGLTDGYGPEPARPLVINEFLAHTDLPDLDAIELFNRANQPVDLSGCYLTDDPQTNRFRIPDGTRLGPRSFIAFDETQLGFRLDAAGETIYLVNAANSRVLDAVRFEGQANGISTGRCPDGAPTFRALAAKTLGTNNSPALSPSIVLNEIMYDPLSGNDDDQYVELYNRGTNRADLSGWKFTAGISYTFRSNTFLAANSYLVVAKNAARMLTNYPNLNAANLVGNFDGALSGRGERLALSMPDQIVSTNAHGVVSTNTIYILVNEVTYHTGGRWGRWANRGGSSLELTDPRSDNSLAPNWADSDETAKAPWTTVEATDVLDWGNNYSPDQLQLILQGEGECLVDNVEVFPVGQANRITNTNFTSGASGWYFQGSYRLSGIDPTGGYGGGPCLHVRAASRGDTGANRIRTVLSPSLSSGIRATLRAKVRWLKGTPEILLRLHGNWLEAPGRLALPSNPGTPGERNSRYLANAGPAITGVTHSPVLPPAGQPVVVTAQVSDPDQVGSVQLCYRNDTSSSTTVTLGMVDDGTGADAAAGDGIYSATIPGQGPGVLVAFYVQATDAAAAPATSRFPTDAPARECLVRFGESVVPGSLGTYRTWLTRSNVSFWANREKNSNEPIDATFVYGNCRAVYNMQTLYSGSPFHTPSYTGPTGSDCDYVLIFPDDERLLGANDFVIATVGNLDNDETAQREQTAFWMLRELGVPSLHRRFIFMYVNGVKRGNILEDAQQPSSDHVAEFFPDDPDGQLHKIEDWFEFDDSGSSHVHVDATLDNFTTTDGAKKAARYRWNWRPRAVQDSSNDFTNLFNLVDALHTTTPEPFTRQVQALVDVEEWMRTFALERFVGNWDSFSYNRGKNMYVYKPSRGPWQMLAWDIDFVLGLGDGATTALFGGQDASVDLMRSHPPFQRAYWRAFQDLLDGPAQDARINPLLDAKYNALVANGVPVGSPASIKGYLAQRRSFVQNQLATSVAASLSISSLRLSNNLALVSGTAPVKLKTLLFNGNEYPITWTGVTSWTATLPLQPGANPFTLLGLDSTGQFVTGASNYVSVTYNETVPSPVGQVVINELMYNPAQPEAAYIELYNTSTNITFDLSGWELRGLSYTFPGGALLGPTNFLVLAADRTAYAAAYNTLMPVFDTFSGALQPDGETLTLVQPGTNAASDRVIAKVRYDASAPWPAASLTAGRSLQLIDARQDNWRAGNWTIAPSNVVTAPQWVFVTTNIPATASVLYLYLGSAGDIYLDDVKVLRSGTNALVNGGFESPLSSGWTVTARFSGSSLSTAVKHGGNSSLHMVATAAGGGRNNSIYQVISPALTTNQFYTLSFWYLQSTNGSPLIVRYSNSLNPVNLNPAPPVSNLMPATPGAANSVAAVLPAFPPLWINELQAENLTGLTNRAGQRTPWLELFNPTTNSVSLDGLYLANSYTNLTAWTFPAGTTLNPRQFKVIFADGQTALSTPGEPHTSFTLAPQAGGVALSRLYNGQPQVLDYVTYTNLTANRSYGSFPDGQSFARQEFYYATPGATNNGSSAPLTVAINEWMADNTVTLADPADDDFEDWFELYNYGTNTVDLGGYFLTDALTNKFQFEIPDNGRYVIPPHGFLLVWADGETKQNSTNRADLHVNFKLDKAGESIGLFGADGTPVDYVTFEAQISDVSMGRYPDGGPSVAFLPAPTPRANNLVPNTPPLLDPISDRVVTLGHTVIFFAHATDPDLPLQELTFKLAAGAPAGATIDPASGQFNWTPTNAPGAWPITVLVSDNGVPSLSATQTFTVTVYAPPQLQDVSLNGNEFTLSWLAGAGQTYQVEFKDTLAAPEWTPLGEPSTGTGSLVTITHLIDSAAPGRFFRVRVLP